VPLDSSDAVMPSVTRPASGGTVSVGRSENTMGPGGWAGG
jgi:hypothetical protein